MANLVDKKIISIPGQMNGGPPALFRYWWLDGIGIVLICVGMWLLFRETRKENASPGYHFFIGKRAE